MQKLIEAVEGWAEARLLLNPENLHPQALKMVTEVGEFVDAVLKGTKEEQKLELGDVLVTLILTSNLLGITLEESLSAAYDKISKRTGKLMNGVFVKD
jgi:NTP pyrophosphatase (non-canonical NTP hydrolase)